MSLPGEKPPRPRQSWIVRTVAKRPSRFLALSESAPHLMRRVASQPSRFVVGLDDFGTDAYPLNPPIASVGGGIIGLEHYLGRVLSVEPSGEVLARVWQRPSGAEGTAVFSLDEDFPTEKPTLGSRLYIWAWFELPGKDHTEKRRHIEVENKAPNSAERSKMKAALAEILSRETAVRPLDD